VWGGAATTSHCVNSSTALCGTVLCARPDRPDPPCRCADTLARHGAGACAPRRSVLWWGVGVDSWRCACGIRWCRGVGTDAPHAARCASTQSRRARSAVRAPHRASRSPAESAAVRRDAAQAGRRKCRRPERSRRKHLKFNRSCSARSSPLQTGTLLARGRTNPPVSSVVHCSGAPADRRPRRARGSSNGGG